MCDYFLKYEILTTLPNRFIIPMCVLIYLYSRCLSQNKRLFIFILAWVIFFFFCPSYNYSCWPICRRLSNLTDWFINKSEIIRIDGSLAKSVLNENYNVPAQWKWCPNRFCSIPIDPPDKPLRWLSNSRNIRNVFATLNIL